MSLKKFDVATHVMAFEDRRVICLRSDINPFQQNLPFPLPSDEDKITNKCQAKESNQTNKLVNSW